jgi:hypothetical protein
MLSAYVISGIAVVTSLLPGQPVFMARSRGACIFSLRASFSRFRCFFERMSTVLSCLLVISLPSCCCAQPDFFTDFPHLGMAPQHPDMPMYALFSIFITRSDHHRFLVWTSACVVCSYVHVAYVFSARACFRFCQLHWFYMSALPSSGA